MYVWRHPLCNAQYRHLQELTNFFFNPVRCFCLVGGPNAAVPNDIVVIVTVPFFTNYLKGVPLKWQLMELVRWNNIGLVNFVIFNEGGQIRYNCLVHVWCTLAYVLILFFSCFSFFFFSSGPSLHRPASPETKGPQHPNHLCRNRGIATHLQGAN